MKISTSGFLYFLKIWSFPIIKIPTLLKNSNQKFVNFTIKVRFFDYLLAKFLTFHRAASDVCSVTQSLNCIPWIQISQFFDVIVKPYIVRNSTQFYVIFYIYVHVLIVKN
jgi:hypothetical protein